MITTKMVRANELSTYTSSLAEIEKEHEYPLDGAGNTFRIDHGASYSAFFSKMGEAYFVLAFHNRKLVGCMAIVSKNIFINEKPRKALYFCDLKLLKVHQGKSISEKMYKAGFWGLLKRGLLISKPFVYFIAMQGEKGDFKQSSHSPFIRTMFRCFADLNIYFSNLDKLLDITPTESNCEDQLWLSDPFSNQGKISNLEGVKELINTQTNIPITLSHITAHPDFMRSAVQHIAECADTSNINGQLCFAIDTREQTITKSLSLAGIGINGTAKAYCIAWDKNTIKDLRVWVGTNEI